MSLFSILYKIKIIHALITKLIVKKNHFTEVRGHPSPDLVLRDNLKNMVFNIYKTVLNNV